LRFSLIVCLVGTFLASLIGIIVGMLSGFSGRLVDAALMGITDSVLALPTLILILAARAAFPLELPPLRAATLLIMIFALAGWAEMARLARGLVRATREQDYVVAAKAVGTSEPMILFRHIFPNIAPALITQATIMLPYFLLSEVALSFLGVGLQEPVPSLGNMLAAASDLGLLQQHPSFCFTGHGDLRFCFMYSASLGKLTAFRPRIAAGLVRNVFRFFLTVQ
jgi:peptide/nickel transport system permease protein